MSHRPTQAEKATRPPVVLVSQPDASYLASKESGYMTGASLTIDGGMSV